MGRLMPPVDITSPSQVGELDKRISIGPITLVLVYADWCGHCQRFKPMMEQLENISGRTVQTARIRDDMVSQSSLKNAKLDGYPSLLLIKGSKNGVKGEDMSKNIIQFKKDDGEISATVPDYTNMAKMTALVKNVGTPAGTAALNASVVPLDNLVNMKNLSTIVVPNAAEKTAARMASPAMNVGTLPSTIVADRLSANTVNELNSQLVKSGTALSKVKSMFSQGQAGGSLFTHLSSAATSVAPAAALFLAASQVKGKKGKTYKKR
jgi:thiol-disulfide isomerase/thioredoxin